MSQTKWSYTKSNTSRQCRRKFFFQYILQSRGMKNKLRRKAYELAKMKNIEMWQGSVVDKVMSEIVIPAISSKEELDFDTIANDAVELAEKQFQFSEHKLYRIGLSKKEREEEELEPCILDIHELEKEYEEVKIFQAFEKIRTSLLNIPVTLMPDGKTLLLDYLRKSVPLIPNIMSWSFSIENIKVNPQIDLVGYNNYKPYVMDWKVSESLSSDYFNQLLVCGLTVYYKRLEKVESEGKKPFSYDEIRLFKVNLLKAEVLEYIMTEDDVNKVIDTINLAGGDIESLESEGEWNEIDIAALTPAENEASCAFCNYKTLCSFLYLNNHTYNETDYLQSIQNTESAGA